MHSGERAAETDVDGVGEEATGNGPIKIAVGVRGEEGREGNEEGEGKGRERGKRVSARTYDSELVAYSREWMKVRWKRGTLCARERREKGRTPPSAERRRGQFGANRSSARGGELIKGKRNRPLTNA